MRMPVAIAFLALTLAVPAARGGDPGRPAASVAPPPGLHNLTGRNLALQGYDPVAYFEQNAAVRGSEELEALHDGVVYRFATEAHRKTFLAEPDRYLPMYGGWCAFGLGMDEDKYGYPRGLYPVDPATFKIIDGRLYLFYNQDGFNALEHWSLDEPGLKAAADAFWREIEKNDPRGRADPR